jgi:hypothetical protein
MTKRTLTLAEKAKNFVDREENSTKTVDDLLDYLKIPKKKRTNFFVACLFKQIKEIE